MSTKTLRKRIALVAVSALGFGVLSSVAPANAAIATLAVDTITQTESVVRASSSAATTVNFTLTGATAGDKISARVDAVPTGATATTVEVGDVFQGTAASATAGSVVIGADKTAVVAATCTNATTGAAAATASRSALGVVTINTAAAHGFNAGQVITTSAALVWDLIDNNANDAQETLLGAGAQITILNVTSTTSFTYLSGNTNELDQEDTTTTANLLRATNTVYTAASGGVVNGTSQVVNAGDTAVDSGQLVCAGITRPATKTVSNDWMSVAGTYTFTVWYDANSDGVKDAGENISGTTSITVGGTPASITVTPQTTIGSEATDYAVWVYLKDAAGNATKLIAGEELSARIDNNTGSPMNALLLDDDADSAGGAAGATPFATAPSLVTDKSYYLYTFSASHSAAFTNGSVKISVNFGGTIAPLATASSASVAILDTGSATSIQVKAGQLGIAESADTLYAFPNAVAAGGLNDIYANPLQALSIVFTITGAPNTYVDVTVDNNGGTSPTGVLATGLTTRTEPVLLNSLGKADYTVTATAAAVGTTYSISAKGGAEYDVTYNAPLVSASSSSIAEMPTGVTKVVTAVGGTSTFNVTVADDYNNKFAGYFVTLTTGSTSRNASKTFTVKSNVDGLATLSLVDAGTTGTDTASVKIYAPNDTVTAIQTWTATITYAANVGGSLSVGGGTTAVADFKAYVAAAGNSALADLDASDGTPTGTDEACVAITHVLRDANLAPLTGYAAKFTGVTPGIKFLTSIDNDDCSTGNDPWDLATTSVFSHANNQTIVYALASKTGVNEVKIEAGGYTQTIKFTAITDASFARQMKLTSPTSSTRQGSGANFVAQVMDGFDNVIQGVNVTFSVTAGRSLSGASSAVVPTDANGNASLALTSDADGVVGLTASLTGAQTTLVAGVPVAAFKAYVAPASGTATIEGISVSAENAQAAADAAAEATDAANAATDAANAAAEAADAATAAAQDAADAVAALSTQVSEMVNALKKQITALTNLVIKIQKKVKA